ncbi:MAG: MFS transporter [Oscillospiraceae bacterium]|nr:MFS transporter [Oscillospiraceae bacterium]
MTKNKIHHAWFIFVVCLGIMGGLVGVLLNCTGIIFAEIIKEFGFRSGDLSIYYTIRSLTRAAALGVVSGWFFRKGQSKKVLIGITALTCLAYMSMGLYTQLWQWYISAFVVGVGTSYTGMALSVLLANWFHSKKGFVMGLAMSASGLLGAVVSPLCSKLIEMIGWRGACVVMGLITFVLVCVPGALFLVLTPEEMGLKPYGYSESVEKSAKKETSRISYSVPAYIFPLCVALICLACLIGAVLNQLPLYSAELGYAVSTGAMLTSFAMIGNVVGKLLTGWLADKAGPYTALTVTFAMVISALAMFIFCTGSRYLLYAAALLFGTIFAVDANIPPLLFMDVYGADYTKHLKNFQTFSFAIGAFSSSLLPYIYDFTHSYNVIFVLGITLVGFSLALTQWLRMWVKNRKS